MVQQHNTQHPFSVFIYDESRSSGLRLQSLLRKNYPSSEVLLLENPSEASGVLSLKRFHIFLVFLKSSRKHNISENALHLLDIINCVYPNQPIPLIAITPSDLLKNDLYTHHHCSHVWDIGFTEAYIVNILDIVIAKLSFFPQDKVIRLGDYPHWKYVTVNEIVYTDHTYREATVFLRAQRCTFRNHTLHQMMATFHQYGFIQCNRFQVVNLAYIESIHSKGKHKHLRLKNNAGILNVGDSYLNDLLKAYSHFEESSKEHKDTRII